MGFGNTRSNRATIIIRFLLLASGVVLFTWTLATPIFRDPEGFLQGSVCLPWAISLGAFLLGWGVTQKGSRFYAWLTMALIGQAVVLQTIIAGNSLHYQHYRTIGELIVHQPWLLAFIIVQASLVGYGLVQRWRDVRTWFKEKFTLLQSILLFAFILLPSAALSPSVEKTLIELIFAGVLQMLNLGTVIIAVSNIPSELLSSFESASQKLLGGLSSSDYDPPSKDRFAVLAGAWVFLLTAALSLFVYQGFPHIPDEIMYHFQARYLSEGLLSIPAPPVPKAFSFYLIPYLSQQWYSIFPPGWPVLLSIGVLLRIHWLVNPLLASLNLILSYFVVRKLFDRWTARLTCLLLCFSPWFIFMGMNLMSHTFSLTCALLATSAMIKARESERSLFSFFSGAALGTLSLVRPFDALIMAILLGLWAIGIGGKRLSLRSLFVFGIGVAVLGALIFPYNRAITGNPLKSPLVDYYERYYGPGVNDIGFGSNRGLGWAIDAFPGHTPIEAILNAGLNTFSVNVELYGWASGSLFFLAIMIVSKKFRSGDYLMIAILVAVPGFYSLYWFNGGPDFGARYWYLAIFPLVVLTVRGIQIISSEKLSEESETSPRRARTLSMVAILCALALVNYFPWRAIDKYHHYLGMRPDVISVTQSRKFEESLVLVQGDQHPDYASAWVYNPLDYSASLPVFAHDFDPDLRIQLIREYDHRQVWILEGPSITGAGYRILTEPATSDTP